MTEIRISKFYAFLHAFYYHKVACKHDVYLRAKLAVSTVNRCFDVAIGAKLLMGAGGDNRQQNYKLTYKGMQTHAVLRGLVEHG